MGRIEAIKRTIILQMSLIGLAFQTALYIYVWQRVYNDIMQSGMWRSFYRKGETIENHSTWLEGVRYRLSPPVPRGFLLENKCSVPVSRGQNIQGRDFPARYRTWAIGGNRTGYSHS